MTKLDSLSHAKVSQAGELLIRAAAVIGTLPPDQQRALEEFSKSIAVALRSAEAISPEVSHSLRTHPPRGFLILGE